MTGETKRFTIMEDHLKLLRNLEVEWNDTEFGSPSFDPKRPFGNSNVYKDMIKALGWILNISVNNIQVNYDLSCNFNIDEDELPDELEEALFNLYRQLDIALEICLRTLSFEPGTYENDVYGDNWRKI